MTIHRVQTAEGVLDSGRLAEPVISKGCSTICGNRTGTHYKLSKLSLTNYSIQVFKSDRRKYFSSARYFFSTILLKSMNRKSLGIHLMNRLSYPQKFTLIGFLFAMPLTLVMYLLISEINSRVDFAQKEIYGNEYLRPLRQLRENIPKLQQLNYQDLNPYLRRPELSVNLEAKIEENFQSLANADRQLGQTLVSTDNFNKLYQNWQNFKLRRSQWSLETYDVVYPKLGIDIDKLRANIGDTSNLILDPDLDTYYLMDATLLKLPEMQRILSEIRLISQKNISRFDATPDEKAKMITLAGKLREYGGRI
jgi:hypothetical protein